MPKRIRSSEPIYVAPEMLGKEDNGRPIVIDERNNGEELDPNNLDHKIKIYERQVKEWFLDNASFLMDTKNCSFVIFMICLSYIEGVEQYKTGTSSDGRSKKVFKESFKRIFPGNYSNDNLELFYKEARCGMFHNGMTEKAIILKTDLNTEIKFEGDNIKVNPKLFFKKIYDDFEKYLIELRVEENVILRENFDRMFKLLP